MAINKPAVKQANEFSASVSGNFWKTSGIFISPDFSHARVFMSMFLSKAAFLSGASPLFEQDYLLQGASNALIPVNLAAISEAAMIAHVADFSGGTYVSGY